MLLGNAKDFEPFHKSSDLAINSVTLFSIICNLLVVSIVLYICNTWELFAGLSNSSFETKCETFDQSQSFFYLQICSNTVF